MRQIFSFNIFKERFMKTFSLTMQCWKDIKVEIKSLQPQAITLKHNILTEISISIPFIYYSM